MIGYDDVRRAVVGRGSVFVAGRAGIVVVQILALPFVTRALTASEFGTVALSLLVSSLLVSLGDAGIPISAARVHFDHGDGPVRARGLAGITLVLGLVVALIVDMTSGLWTTIFRNLEYGPVLRLGVWMTAPAMVRNVSLSLLRAEDRPIAHSVVAVVSAAGGQATGLILLLAAGAGPVGYVGGILAGAVVSAAIGWVIAGGRIPTRSRSLRLGAVLAFSLPTVPRSAASSLLDSGDRFVVERFAGLTDVGRYQVGYRVGSLAMIVTSELARALVPIAYDPRTPSGTAIPHMQAIVSKLACAMALGLACAGPLVLGWFAPAGYRPGDLSIVTGLVAAAAVPHAFVAVAGLGLLRVKRTSPLAVITLAAAVANLALAAIGVSLIGLAGAAGATLIAFGLEAVALQRSLRTHVGVARTRPGVFITSSITVVGCCLVALLPTGETAWDVIRLLGTVVSGLWFVATAAGR